jgi:hypothetical protein
MLYDQLPEGAAGVHCARRALSAPVGDHTGRPEWGMDESSQKGLIEFAHHPAHIGMVGQGLDALEHFLHQFCPDFGHTLLRVPGVYRLKIEKCGFREADNRPWHCAISNRAASWPHCIAMILQTGTVMCGFV